MTLRDGYSFGARTGDSRSRRAITGAEAARSCSFKLQRPVFGGRAGTPLRVAYRLTQQARVTLTVTRGGRTVLRRAGVREPGGPTGSS